MDKIDIPNINLGSHSAAVKNMSSRGASRGDIYRLKHTCMKNSNNGIYAKGIRKTNQTLKIGMYKKPNPKPLTSTNANQTSELRNNHHSSPVSSLIMVPRLVSWSSSSSSSIILGSMETIGRLAVAEVRRLSPSPSSSSMILGSTEK